MKRLQHSFGRRAISFLLAVSCLCSAAAPGTVYALEGADTSIQQTVNDQTAPDGNTDPSGNSTPEGNTNPDGNADPDGNGDLSASTDPEEDVTPGGGVETFSLVPSEKATYWVMKEGTAPSFSVGWFGETEELVTLEVTFPQGMVLELVAGENTDWTLDDSSIVKCGDTAVATLTASEGVTLALKEEGCSYTPAATTEENSAPASLNLTFTCTPPASDGDQGDGNGEGTTGSDGGVQPLDNKNATITFQLESDVLNSTACTLRQNGENYDYGTLGFTVTAGDSTSSTSVKKQLRVVPALNTAQVVAKDGTPDQTAPDTVQPEQNETESQSLTRAYTSWLWLLLLLLLVILVVLYLLRNRSNDPNDEENPHTGA